jgi:hypothetical protein
MASTLSLSLFLFLALWHVLHANIPNNYQWKEECRHFALQCLETPVVMECLSSHGCDRTKQSLVAVKVCHDVMVTSCAHSIDLCLAQIAQPNCTHEVLGKGPAAPTPTPIVNPLRKCWKMIAICLSYPNVSSCLFDTGCDYQPPVHHEKYTVYTLQCWEVLPFCSSNLENCLLSFDLKGLLPPGCSSDTPLPPPPKKVDHSLLHTYSDYSYKVFPEEKLD